MTGKGLEDSFLQPTDGSATLSHLTGMLRTSIRDIMAGEDPPANRELTEVIAALLAYCVAIERVLSQAAGRTGTLPGHAVSVRGYVEQALSGEAREAAILRLSSYFKDAITYFMKTHSGQQDAIDRFAQDLVAAIRPGNIEDRVKPNPILKMFGLHEGAFWREFRDQYRSLDAAGIKQLVEDQRHREGRA